MPIDLRNGPQRRLGVLQARITKRSNEVGALIAERNHLIVEEWLAGTRMGDLSALLSTDERAFTVSAVRKVIRERTKQPRQVSFDARRQRGEPVVRRLVIPKRHAATNGVSQDAQLTN